jgi:outer membrane receptor protein involved in Fe transport
LITNGSKFVWLLPNEDADPMAVQQISLGIEYDTPHIFIGLDVYNNVIDNITDYSQLVFPVDTYIEETSTLVFKGSRTAKGLELLVRKKDGYLRGWAAYNYGIVECEFPDMNGGKTFLADHDRTHELKSVIIWSLGPWNMAVTGLISSGRVYTPNNNLMIRENENANYTLVADAGTRNSKRLPIVNRIDMSVTRSLQLLAKNWDIGVSIFNLFNNRRNISHRSYNLTTDPFITTDIVMLGLTPTLSIRLEL